MNNYSKHSITTQSPIKEALVKLNELAADAIIFVVNSEGRLLGSLTDGDVRRGLLNGLDLDSPVDHFIQQNPKFIQQDNYTIHQIIEYKRNAFRILPVVNKEHVVTNVINFRFLKSYLPVDAVIMAGGRGERLKPLTDVLPKPLLKVGDKPIIQHNIDRLTSFGINNLWISLRYLSDQIKDYIGKNNHEINVQYINEDQPLGTAGSIALIPEFSHDYILLMNSDILTNLDYEQFFIDFIESDADFSVATVPYHINVPYAILETNENTIISFREKPTYTYFANAGIYLMKKEVVKLIPKNTFFNATDLIELLITRCKKVISHSMTNYWLDIGKHEDLAKAQEDIKHLDL
ncbi:MAG: nucleotidyltransferase family protein [Sphingobacteriaceae bacterium]|jgi:dTDP-glucose pyrophosphorylase|nr:MAG: CBS domain-containing protein [Pedobacter sp.]